MKKQSVQLYLIIWSIVTIPIHILGMAPAQVAQKERQFNQILNQYKQEASKSGVLTIRGAQLFQDAIKIINELSRYVTTDKLKQQLLSIQTESQKQIVDQRAAVQFNKLIELFGTTQKATPRAFTKAPSGSTAYYNDLANKVMSYGLSILQNFYPTNQQTAVRNNVLYVGQNDINGMIQLAQDNKGGALYWINQHLDMVFNLMNMFGNKDGKVPYGRNDMLNFIVSRNYFLQNLRDVLETMYQVSNNGNISWNDNDELLLPNKKNYLQLLNIGSGTGNTLLGYLYRDLANYNLFVRDIMQANNITQAQQNMKKFVETIKIVYPSMNDDGTFTMSSEGQPQEIQVLLQFTTWSNTIKQLDEQIKIFNKNWEMFGKYQITQHRANLQKELAQLFENEKKSITTITKQYKIQLEAGTGIITLEQDIVTLWNKLKDKPIKFDEESLKNWSQQTSWFGIQKEERTQFINKIGILVLTYLGAVFDKINQAEILKVQANELRQEIKLLKAQPTVEEKEVEGEIEKEEKVTTETRTQEVEDQLNEVTKKIKKIEEIMGTPLLEYKN